MSNGTEPLSLSGLTEEQAKDFHGAFVRGFIGFTAIAVVAHVLAWSWRPWLPGPEGYETSMIDIMRGAEQVLTFLS